LIRLADSSSEEETLNGWSSELIGISVQTFPCYATASPDITSNVHKDIADLFKRVYTSTQCRLEGSWRSSEALLRVMLAIDGVSQGLARVALSRVNANGSTLSTQASRNSV
jgi:hypothetical protein